MTRRRLPNPAVLAGFLRFPRPHGSRLERRLGHAHTIDDLREQARRRVPRAVFDYVEGAADGEISARENLAAFERVRFRPSYLRDVADIDLQQVVLGRPSRLPFAFAPTGFTRLAHHEGERAVATVAARRGIPYSLSTMGTVSLEEIATRHPAARRWFQLYIWKDRGAGRDMIARAMEAGYEALVLTIDVPVSGGKLRDTRSGFTFPPALTARTVMEAARHPGWWANLLTTEPLSFASLQDWDGATGEKLVNRLFDPSVTEKDLQWVRDQWPGPLIVKGVQTASDARRTVDAGADAVIVSNHGGRQLDRSRASLLSLRDVVAEVGRGCEVWLDSGIRSGGDIIAALALGATTTLVGRAYLYGLMAGGVAGVDRAVDLLEAEMRRTMQLLGVRRLDDLGPEHVELG